MNYSLPKSLKICEKEYRIESDYRAVLDICAALTDIELSDREKTEVALKIFYPDFSEIPVKCYEEAVEKCFWFINCGANESKKNTPKLIDWEQDFKFIVAPINRVCGKEIRELEYMHWWTFISYYYEIGDCLFAQIVRIRNLKRKGKNLDKQDKEWYNQNRELVDFKVTYTEEEDKLLTAWGV